MAGVVRTRVAHRGAGSCSNLRASSRRSLCVVRARADDEEKHSKWDPVPLEDRRRIRAMLESEAEAEPEMEPSRRFVISLFATTATLGVARLQMQFNHPSEDVTPVYFGSINGAVSLPKYRVNADFSNSYVSLSRFREERGKPGKDGKDGKKSPSSLSSVVQLSTDPLGNEVFEDGSGNLYFDQGKDGLFVVDRSKGEIYRSYYSLDKETLVEHLGNIDDLIAFEDTKSARPIVLIDKKNRVGTVPGAPLSSEKILEEYSSAALSGGGGGNNEGEGVRGVTKKLLQKVKKSGKKKIGKGELETLKSALVQRSQELRAKGDLVPSLIVDTDEGLF